jgi:hypothetical protein
MFPQGSLDFGIVTVRVRSANGRACAAPSGSVNDLTFPIWPLCFANNGSAVQRVDFTAGCAAGSIMLTALVVLLPTIGLI